jgi:hypothetical protein
MTVFFAWLAAWGIGTAFFLLLVAAGMVLHERKELKAAGATRPLTIIWWTLRLRIAGRLLADLGDGCVGRAAWLDWDFRWGPYGQTMATVAAKYSSTELSLRSELGIPFPGTRQFTFKVIRATPSFAGGTGAAAGFLIPLDNPSDSPASATLVLL